MEKLVTTLRLTIPVVSAEHERLIFERNMRPQSSALHIAYNRWREGLKEKEIQHLVQEKFPCLTAWAVKSAVREAKAILASQSALLEKRRSYLVSKIEKLTRKCEHNQKVLPRLTQAQADLEAIQQEIASGKVAPVTFGGKKLWRDVSRQVAGAKEKWRRARSGQYYSIGGGSDLWGNREFQFELSQTDGQAVLKIRVPSEIPGEKPTWVPLQGFYTRKQKRLFKLAASGLCITVRLVSEAEGRMVAMITLGDITEGTLIPDKPSEKLPRKSERIAGIDLNLDHLAISLADQQGQYRGTVSLPYVNLGELPESKTKSLVGKIAKEVVSILVAQKAREVTLEDLVIKREPEKSLRFNRRTNPFPYRQLHEAISRRALREGMTVKLVHPAYTSLIGQNKYMDQYGISRHAAAAYVIARRGMGLLEKLPKRTIRCLKSMGHKSKKDSETIANWKSFSPLAGKPWVLWALLARKKNVSLGVAIPVKGTTNGRNDMSFRPGNADNIRLEVPPDSRSGVNISGMPSLDGT